MPDETYDILRRALLSALGPRPTAERRRQVAADLRALAEQQERMAAAERRAATPEHPVPAEKPGRPAGFYVRINQEQEPRTGALRLRLSIGRQIWSEIGAPARVDVQRTGGEIWVVPAKGAAGYELATGIGLPSCVLSPTGPLAQLAPGRYAATLRAGAIVIGARVA
jgi:hypothetical protein